MLGPRPARCAQYFSSCCAGSRRRLREACCRVHSRVICSYVSLTYRITNLPRGLSRHFDCIHDVIIDNRPSIYGVYKRLHNLFLCAESTRSQVEVLVLVPAAYWISDLQTEGWWFDKYVASFSSIDRASHNLAALMNSSRLVFALQEGPCLSHHDSLSSMWTYTQSFLPLIASCSEMLAISQAGILGFRPRDTDEWQEKIPWATAGGSMN